MYWLLSNLKTFKGIKDKKWEGRDCSIYSEYKTAEQKISQHLCCWKNGSTLLLEFEELHLTKECFLSI